MIFGVGTTSPRRDLRRDVKAPWHLHHSAVYASPSTFQEGFADVQTLGLSRESSDIRIGLAGPARARTQVLGEGVGSQLQG